MERFQRAQRARLSTALNVAMTRIVIIEERAP